MKKLSANMQMKSFLLVLVAMMMVFHACFITADAAVRSSSTTVSKNWSATPSSIVYTSKFAIPSGTTGKISCSAYSSTTAADGKVTLYKVSGSTYTKVGSSYTVPKNGGTIYFSFSSLSPATYIFGIESKSSTATSKGHLSATVTWN